MKTKSSLTTSEQVASVISCKLPRTVLDFVQPKTEENFSVSLFVESSESGVNSLLSPQLKQEPTYNGLQIEDLRELEDIRRLDKLDGYGLAKAKLANHADAYGKSALHTQVRKSNSKK